MRVCIVSPNIVPYFEASPSGQYGGAEVQAAILADGLSRAGCDIVVLTTDLTDGRQVPFDTVNAFHSTDGVPGIRFFHPRATGILAALKRADADVYYQRNAGMITGLVAWFCRRNQRAFVYGAGSDADFSSRKVLITGRRDRAMYFYGIRHSDGVVVQNQTQAEACRESLGRDPIVIPNAVYMHREEAARDGSVVWVGHLSRVKRPEVFVELARRIPDREFVMVGGPIESEKAFGESITRDASALTNLTLTGRIQQKDAMAYIERAAMLVNTSEFEGFPNTFLEAWARRTPVLSMVDVDDLIATSGAGRVCRSIDEMAGSIQELQDPGLREAMGESGWRLVDERYNIEQLAPSYVQFFEALTSKGNQR